VVVRFKHVKTLELLVQNRKRLELLCLAHLRLEPVLDLVLLFFDQVLVVVVEVSDMVRRSMIEVGSRGTCSVAAVSPAISAQRGHVGRRHQPTISSEHIGHTSRLDALAAALSLGPDKTRLPMSSLGSAVLAGLLDVCELSDTELSEGDRKLVFRRCWCWCWGLGCGETAGDRFRPLPSTRPPPRDLREAMSSVSRMFGGGHGPGHAA